MRGPDANGTGWLLVSPELAPPDWRRRAIPLLLVPLDPDQAERLLTRPSEPPLHPDERRLAEMVATGTSPRIIARELELPLRTVYRRLAALRERFGARSTPELATELARRGF